MAPILGTPGDDVLTGTAGNDTILGGAGNDVLSGGPSQPLRLQGGAGNLADFEPKIAALPDGGFVVTWRALTSDGQLNDIFLQRFGADGVAVGGMQRLPGMAFQNELTPEISSLSDGGFVVAWRGFTNDGQSTDIFLQRFDADGAAAGGVQRLQGMAGNLSDQFAQITSLPDGGFAVNWSGNTSDGQNFDVFVQTYDGNGTAMGGIQRLQGMPGALHDVTPQGTALADGGFVISWMGQTSDGQGNDVFVQRFDADGTVTGGPQRLQGMPGSLIDGSNVITSLPDGGFVVAWSGGTLDGQNNDIFVQRFDADGDMTGDLQRLQGMAGILSDSTPDITSLSDGGFAVAWSGGTSDGQFADIFVQRFGVDGTPAGDPERLQGMAGSVPDTSPQIASLSGGGYAVVWQAGTTDGQGSDIFVQRFGADGTRGGEQYRLQGNTGNLNDNTPEITSLPDGGFVVTWAGQTSDGQGYDIFVQRFDANGLPVTPDGDDLLEGGPGDDTLIGGPGDDTLTGGPGDDVFVWQRTGNTTITDFGTTPGDEDFVDLSGLFNDATLAAYNTANGTSFTQPLKAMNHDLADGRISFNGTDMTGPHLTMTGVTGGLGTDQTGVTCFAAGTRIQTVTGPRAVETLSAGDPVLTLDHGYCPLRWIGCSPVDLIARPLLAPVRIPAGALGCGLPERALLVSPQHRVLVRSAIAMRMTGTPEVLVAAHKLVGTAGIHIAQDLARVDYWHLLFDRHQVIRSEGALTESLFTGPEALRAVPPEARAEIMALFPHLTDPGHDARPDSPARPILHGHRARSLAARHRRNARPLSG
ncbi:MAG: Hint domain-containing protein [Pararhodobacter sp.]